MEVLLPAEVARRHCGEAYELMIDSSQGSISTIEDCTVCCRPILLEIECKPGEIFAVAASAQ